MPLAQETDMSRDAGFTMSLATYDEGGSTDTVERRRKSVSGLLGLSVRMDDFIREIVNSSQAEGISVEIYDGKVAYHAHSVFDTDTVDPGNARHYDDSKFFSMEKNEIF